VQIDDIKRDEVWTGGMVKRYLKLQKSELVKNHEILVNTILEEKNQQIDELNKKGDKCFMIQTTK